MAVVITTLEIIYSLCPKVETLIVIIPQRERKRENSEKLLKLKEKKTSGKEDLCCKT